MTKRTLILTPLLAMSLAAPFNMGSLSALGQSGLALLDTALRDPAALIAGRSPGARGDNLIQTKPALRTAGGTGPQERVLDEVRTRPVVAPPAPALPAPVDSIAIGPAQEDSLPLALITGSASPNGVPGLADGVPLLAPNAEAGGGIPPFGGGSSGGGGTLPPPVAPVSPVPEPSMWVLLISGFFAVGIGLRKQKRRQFLQA